MSNLNHREEAEKILEALHRHDQDNTLHRWLDHAQVLATMALAHATLAANAAVIAKRDPLRDMLTAAGKPIVADIAEPKIVYQGEAAKVSSCGPKYTTDDVRALSGLLDD